jgi:ArsR family transcriptional regulator, arsenate/arsenite/antimonite-responsive transcriptional repressor
MTRVPATVRPDLPPDTERAIDVFGNRVRVAVVSSLRAQGPATRTELASRLNVSRSLLQAHVRRLVALGILRPEPAGTQADHRRRVYQVDESEVERLLQALQATVAG